jgi:hypothetical protein
MLRRGAFNYRTGFFGLLVLCPAFVAWTWITYQPVDFSKHSANVRPACVTLHSHPSKVQIVIDDFKTLNSVLYKPMERGVRAPDGVSFKLIGYVEFGDRAPAIRLFHSAFDAGNGIHTTDFSALERLIRDSLERANESFAHVPRGPSAQQLLELLRVERP